MRKSGSKDGAEKRGEERRGKRRGPIVFTAVYMTALFAAAVWILLDQFVIRREIGPLMVAPEPTVQVTAEPTPEITEAPTPEPTAEPSDTPTTEPTAEPTPEITDAPAAESMETPTAEPTAEPTPEPTAEPTEEPTPEPTEEPLTAPRVEMTEIRIYDTNVHIAEIWIPDASYLRTALAENTFGRNIKQTVAEMAGDNDALIAINGDYCGFRSDGYVIRNGILYREDVYDSDQEDLCIWPDGSMTVVRETEVGARELMAQGVRDVICFGPALILDGEIQISPTLEVGTYSDDNPRTVIGMIEPLHYLFVVSDGRTDHDKGLTLYQLAELTQDYGVRLLYNLDGGGSSTMVYEGEIVNFPTARGYREERRVSDIVYIAR